MDDTNFVKKKSLGQHFLTSAIVPRWLADAGEVTAGDTVLEIGPGTGVLTKELLTRGAHVVALEADQRAIAVLKETYAAELAEGQLCVHHTDVRSLDLSQFSLTDHGFKVVANIPYYLSGFLFRSLLESVIQPTTLVFLVQKEIARRIATDEKESLLSLSVKVYGNPRYVKTVSRGYFSPPPKVDSAIIAISDITRDRLTGVDQNAFFSLLHFGFGQKRKQLLGNLAHQYERSKLTHMFSTLGISPTVRAEDVPLNTWLDLAKNL